MLRLLLSQGGVGWQHSLWGKVLVVNHRSGHKNYGCKPKDDQGVHEHAPLMSWLRVNLPLMTSLRLQIQAFGLDEYGSLGGIPRVTVTNFYGMARPSRPGAKLVPEQEEDNDDAYHCHTRN